MYVFFSFVWMVSCVDTLTETDVEGDEDAEDIQENKVRFVRYHLPNVFVVCTVYVVIWAAQQPMSISTRRVMLWCVKHGDLFWHFYFVV